jgi:hypothetical protein
MRTIDKERRNIMLVEEKSYVIENINKLPEDFLKKLMNLLNDESKMRFLLSTIDKSGITLGRNNYQITFNCQEEIIAARDLLNIQFKNDTV